MSWSTNASRSAGAKVSNTTRSARPTESASDEECKADRIGKQGLVLRLKFVLPLDDRVRDVRGEGLFASNVARTQHVEADASDDCRQPPAKVLHRVGV
jgi:hypothetical protein